MRAHHFVLLAVLALPAVAAAAPIVHTDTREVRACLPLPEGGALVGTGGGLVRVDAAGVRREVWTAADGLPGTRIEALIADGDRLWVGADGGGARITARRWVDRRVAAGRCATSSPTPASPTPRPGPAAW
jgi:hypothetical protein